MTIYYNERDNTFTLTYNGVVVFGFATCSEAVEYYNNFIKGITL